MAELKAIKDYIYENKSLVLATVDEAGKPQIRHIGGYTIDGKDILFSTGKDTDKTREIANNNNVALLFQHEGQQALKNVTLYGKARKLDEEETKKAVDLIKIRRPQLRYTPEANIIYRVESESVKVLDFSKEERQVVFPASELA
ncbi:MAG: pyridoxamine 5'-phosphate oxidase family protein [Pseudobutyrivibrio ruminis]|uniref:Pyridoxamine 5'-phosphate oxidase family protein n=1 Tax=Pseudobutyrivibrio ruminis TaxID=46206 RepID=A0A927U9A8_9FIRM|nr:pyridoxamine 5'-phosphate oxidase family protein [Pseudobutyrivibrio sp.]MBE5918370.1 pyridoxamine 5'-phosphate oxidase family protein [Pseudobutyrivibrio ruminis]MBQ6463458.1 pyridoxamine 5'-phosphate oxidase family protein [Pseudobutyrivibrio sp.]